MTSNPKKVFQLNFLSATCLFLSITFSELFPRNAANNSKPKSTNKTDDSHLIYAILKKALFLWKIYVLGEIMYIVHDETVYTTFMWFCCFSSICIYLQFIYIYLCKCILYVDCRVHLVNKKIWAWFNFIFLFIMRPWLTTKTTTALPNALKFQRLILKYLIYYEVITH